MVLIKYPGTALVVPGFLLLPSPVIAFAYQSDGYGHSCAAEQKPKCFLHGETSLSFKFPPALIAAELDTHFAVDVFAHGAAGGGSGYEAHKDGQDEAGDG